MDHQQDVAGGRYEVPSSAEINEPDYEPWTDEYGQWRHDDWVGKIWNQQDAVDQYAKLKQYMAANPGPSEWNKWGGWEAGPQLEATGWFRVEKYNDRWWFVDPDGKLFLSQGSLHMSANTPKPAADAGYTDETYPDEIYFPRLRSMGLNTAGGNSSWKWHEGKMPYTYQIKTGWAPITESDFLNGGEVAFAQHVRDLVFQAQNYASDPYCIGFIVDNELNISGGDTLPKDEVERIYFSAVRSALDELSAAVGRPPMIMIDPASNGGYWMAYYSDVLSMHRMDGYTPATHKDKFDSLGSWGIDRPVGQFTFSMGNLDVGVAHYGLTMFLNQRNRAQGMSRYMRQAYEHKNNIATHIYPYMKTSAKPMTEFRAVTNITDTTDYWLAKYVGGIGHDMYYIHNGMEVPKVLLSLSKTDGVDTVQAGDVLTYTLTCANDSTATGAATDVVLRETYDPNVTYLNAVPAPDTGTDNLWSLGTLAPGETGVVNVTVQVASPLADGTQLTNTVTIEADLPFGHTCTRCRERQPMDTGKPVARDRRNHQGTG